MADAPDPRQETAGPALPGAVHAPLVDGDAVELARTCELLRRELDAARAECARFATRLAHDAQGVLQNIGGYAEALQHRSGNSLDDKGRHYLQRIVQTSARGDQLVQDLLTFTRLANQPVERARVQLDLILARARSRVAPLLQGRAVEVRICSLPIVDGDAALLEVAFSHLLANAIRATSGREEPAIAVTAAAVPGGCEVRVSDNGTGLEGVDLERLFLPLERGGGIGTFGGSGLGLATVRRIAERLGGSVRAEPVPAGGAAFALTLLTPGSGRPELSSPAVAPGAACLRILVVDDDPMVLASLRNMLQLDGHEVVTATGGRAGVEDFLAATRAGAPFSVVISDLGMPRFNGLQVAAAVKEAWPATWLILLTGDPGGVGEHGVPDARVDVVLGKPVNMKRLRQCLATVAGAPAAARPPE